MSSHGMHFAFPIGMLSDTEQLTCIDCGTTLDAEEAVADRVFALTAEIVLCHACALRRGGVYDDAEDKWKIAPRLEGVHAHV